MDSLNLISTSFRTEYKKTPLQLKVGSCQVVFWPLQSHQRVRQAPDHHPRKALKGARSRRS